MKLLKLPGVRKGEAFEASADRLPLAATQTALLARAALLQTHLRGIEALPEPDRTQVQNSIRLAADLEFGIALVAEFLRSVDPALAGLSRSEILALVPTPADFAAVLDAIVLDKGAPTDAGPLVRATP